MHRYYLRAIRSPAATTFVEHPLDLPRQYVGASATHTCETSGTCAHTATRPAIVRSARRHHVRGECPRTLRAPAAPLQAHARKNHFFANALASALASACPAARMTSLAASYVASLMDELGMFFTRFGSQPR